MQLQIHDIFFDRANQRELLSRSVGSHLEISAFAREASVSSPTVKKYLGALAQSQLIFKLYGYQFGPAKRFLKAAKSYFSDIGILQSLNTQPSTGQILENFVISELEKRRKLGYINTDQRNVDGSLKY